jgi:hypothetical protein
VQMTDIVMAGRRQGQVGGPRVSIGGQRSGWDGAQRGYTGGGSNITCTTQGGEDVRTDPTTPLGAQAKSLLLIKGTWLYTATLLSQAMRAWDHLGVSTLQTPWVVGSPGVVLLDELRLGKESMTVRMARMRDRTRRMVVEEMVL